jgi:hypothetical protein
MLYLIVGVLVCLVMALYAVSTTPIGSALGGFIVQDTDSDGTSENDVRVGACTLYMVDVDNSANAAVSYLKLYDSASPTVGTTAPDMIFKVPASVRRVFAIPDGVAFTNLSFACVTTAGTAGTTNPTSNVTVKLVTS